MALDAWHQSVP